MFLFDLILLSFIVSVVTVFYEFYYTREFGSFRKIVGSRVIFNQSRVGRLSGGLLCFGVAFLYVTSILLILVIVCGIVDS